jgi:hypothetical protein
MHDFMMGLCIMLFVVHSLAAIYPGERIAKRGLDVELWRRHHEVCMCLLLVALAILSR